MVSVYGDIQAKDEFTHPLGAEARDAACDSLDEIGTALGEDAARGR